MVFAQQLLGLNFCDGGEGLLGWGKHVVGVRLLRCCSSAGCRARAADGVAKDSLTPRHGTRRSCGRTSSVPTALILAWSSFPWCFVFPWSKKPLTRISKRVPGAHGKRGLERGWQKGWQRVGERLAKGWRRVGTGLAKGWRRARSGFPCTFPFRNSRGARLETRVCDSMPWSPWSIGLF